MPILFGMSAEPFSKKAISFQFFSGSVVPEILHALISVKGLLVVTRKGLPNLTAEDVARILNHKSASEELVESMRKNVMTAAEAAAIIFMHSTCENAVFALIKLLVGYDPDPWIAYVSKRNVAFEEVSSSTRDEIKRRLLDEYLEKLEKESFPKKVDLLLAAIKPSKTSDVISGFAFDKGVFVRIDELRHRLTHDPSFAKPIDNAAIDLSYLVDTLRWLVALSEQKYPGATKAELN